MIRRTVDGGLLLLAGAYLIAALVGLPLFGDGGYYFFKLVTDHSLLLPNLRYTALLPQLPGLAAASITTDPLLLRHVFSVSYQALPWLSLGACWLLVRRRMPRLMLLPLLSLAVNLVNFSAVSELLSGLYLVWPLVLALALMPDRPWVRVFAFVTAPLLLALHPMAFVLAFALALAALLVAWQQPAYPGARQSASANPWRWLALWLALNGLLRLLWTAFGINAYERGVLSDAGMVHYLLPETLAQSLLLLFASCAGLIFVADRLLLGATKRHSWALRAAAAGAHWWLALCCALLLLAALAVSVEFVLGDGIKLKAAATFVVAVLLMGLAFLAASAPLRSALAGSIGLQPAAPDTARADAGLWPFPLVMAAILLLVLAKSSAWWTATRGLQDTVADSSGPCIAFAVDRPFGLQWPWMSSVDDWVAPINALAFRPRIPRADGQGIEPIALLLPGDGCRLLDATGEAHFTDWMHRPWTLLDQRFGPLRRPAALAAAGQQSANQGLSRQ
jgi:hypothetical protein